MLFFNFYKNMKNFFKPFLFLLILFSFFSSSVALAAVPTLETNPDVLTPLGITAGSTSNNLIKRIQEFIFKLTTESLKKSLLDALVGQMVTGIAGGEPKFVTNWESFLNQNYNLGREEAINSLESSGFFNSGNNFDSLLKSSMTGNFSSYVPYEKTVEEKYNDEYGAFDWNTYNKSWLPENNYYGKSYIAKNIIDQKAAAKTEAAKNEAISGGGFLSTKDSNGNVSTPGKTIGDTLSRAVTSDIDYIVNAEDIASFVSAISSSVFNKLLGSGASGIIGVAGDILGGGGIGTVSFDLSSGSFSLGEFGNISLGSIDNILFNSDSDSGLSSVSGSIPRSVSGTSNTLISEELESLNNSDYNSLLGYSSDYSSYALGDYGQNKVSSYDEVQKTIWYLNDLSTIFSLKWEACDDSPEKYLIPFSSEAERNNLVSKIETVSSKLKTLLSNLESEIIANASSTAEKTEEEIFSSSVEKELLSNLYAADISLADSSSENFDLSGNLPINLNPNSGYEIKKKAVRSIPSLYSGTIYASSSCPAKTNLAYAYPSTPVQNLFFFRNKIKTKVSNSFYGEGNLFGLSISSSNNEFFFVHPENISSYLSFLEEKISRAENISSVSDSKALSRLISFKQNKKLSLTELNKAALYLADVDNKNSNISFLKNNFSSELPSLKKTSVSEDDLNFSQNQSSSLYDFFSVGLGQKSGNDFDGLNKLPLNLNNLSASTGEVVSEKATGNIKTPLASYSGNLNFLGRPVANLFYFHPYNLNNYLSVLDSKVSELKGKGYLK